MKTFELAALLVITLLSALRADDNDFDQPLPTDDPKAFALYQACSKGDLSVVKDLIGGGAPIDGHIGKYAYTPLIAAGGRAHLDVLKYLIDYRANLDMSDNQGSTALLHDCFDDHADCALALIDAGAHVNFASNGGRTPLMYAAMHGNDRIVADLIAHKAKLDANCSGGAALQWAVSSDHLSTAKLLGAAGANPNLVAEGGNPGNYSILGQAASNGNLEMIDYLLSIKADVNSPNGNGDTALIAAADFGHAEAIDRLLENGAGIDLKNKDGRTALMMACTAGETNCVRTLIDRKADINLTDLRGETALTMAGDGGEVDIVELLKDKGAQRTDVHIIAKGEPPQALSPAHAWELSVGVMYTQRGGFNPKILGGGESVKNSEIMLNRDWKIHDKESLISELDDLRDHGHHESFQDHGAKLALMSDDQFNQLLAAHPDKATEIKAMRDSYLKWKDHSGLAWDICRSANLVNAGFAAHYFNEQEAWDRFTAIAQQAQSNFSSWQEMSDNFLDGREIWANKRDPRFEAIAQLLLNPKDPNSPWNQNSWKTELTAN